MFNLPRLHESPEVLSATSRNANRKYANIKFDRDTTAGIVSGHKWAGAIFTRMPDALNLVKLLDLVLILAVAGPISLHHAGGVKRAGRYEDNASEAETWPACDLRQSSMRAIFFNVLRSLKHAASFIWFRACPHPSKHGCVSGWMTCNP